ncbi:hypothetical protein SEA_VANLEE_84 [Gordonia phage VanLee]|uniref:Uncharacterized protein n=1 Tax=Gordonia phage VanLee TaxID=2845816 RepID=A0A8F2IFG1_9CAUD|nr:hypothetical protein QEH49_gp084 [Gordonia phage VanLee]QWS68201.1 hypothetical protein SEA_VANLEE_84 [Gordonia phage VanLee]
MAKAEDPKTLAILRNVAAMAETSSSNGSVIVDLEDGRFLTLVVVGTKTGEPE